MVDKKHGKGRWPTLRERLRQGELSTAVLMTGQATETLRGVPLGARERRSCAVELRSYANECTEVGRWHEAAWARSLADSVHKLSGSH